MKDSRSESWFHTCSTATSPVTSESFNFKIACWQALLKRLNTEQFRIYSVPLQRRIMLFSATSKRGTFQEPTSWNKEHSRNDQSSYQVSIITFQWDGTFSPFQQKICIIICRFHFNFPLNNRFGGYFLSFPIMEKLWSLVFVNKYHIVGGLSSLMSVFVGLSPSISCRIMDRTRPMRKKMIGQMSTFRLNWHFLPMNILIEVLIPTLHLQLACKQF